MSTNANAVQGITIDMAGQTVRCRLVAMSALSPLRAEEPFQVWNPESPSARFFHSDSGIRVAFPGIAVFEIPPVGDTVLCALEADTGDRWRAVFQQQVVPLVLSGQGAAIFHGGAVVVDGGAVAFLAPSGLGKSTLTTACAVRGMPFLGDDCLHLAFAGEGRPNVLPQPPFVRVWDDSLAYAAPDEVAREHPSDFPKPRLLAGVAMPHCDRAMPLRAVYVLEESEDGIRVERLAGTEVVMAWVANAFVLDIKDPATLRRVMARAAALARVVPMARLRYPRRYDCLDAVVARIAGDVSDGASTG